MKTAFVLGLALALGILLAASPAPAFDPSKQGALRIPVDPWAHWPPRQQTHHFHGHQFHGHKFHGGTSTLIVVPGATPVPNTVWVPAQWAWTGFRWVWVPGHWRSW
jgi:hypothetical protein